MTKVGEVYECEICGNKVKVVEAGKGTLVCCGQPMTKVGG
ncbi:MAG: desulfoferrodoxin FeS4 iron-binding domain-containing protein [Methanomassiliicoccales archaeon]|nr:desulfoferrodoxin FeS4 iron-binding domain-containing protein [Methanomassiliicoccales archaeon]MCE5261471.1 desulfoferrodoxin FeS4 iron-binding domain-containing protein [Euryarchaeota archaeon]HOO03869.1 desulfoferrodoxin FeS4 iron-binding domain-containing protein [Methanomassiliicoccales archaeon]HQM66775.1 desulfoferrodoxin FeS4 iron-binding domain-containing protein [Methanomassiliicoccales archaeon]HRR66574.1 desulfoferrodoxin FeS4 iron-binding domain-containing protein [Methanomassil